MADLVRWEIAGDVATITLDSPHNRNALSTQLTNELHDALDDADAAAVRVAVLTNLGPSFCSGADLRERSSGRVDATPMAKLMERIPAARYPVVAAVDGVVRAGGIGLMAACDLVVVRPDATFAFTEVRIGAAPAIISVPILNRCGWSRVAAAFLTGADFGAAAALDMGLVTHVAGDVHVETSQLVAGILAGGPNAVAAAKALLRHPLTLAAAQRVSEDLFDAPEAREGMRAFVERRPPAWTTGTPT